MKIINIIFMSIMFTACGVNRNSFDSNYRGETNYKSFYVVDTIKIENPIIVNDHGRKVICSKAFSMNSLALVPSLRYTFRKAPISPTSVQ